VRIAIQVLYGTGLAPSVSIPLKVDYYRFKSS